MKPLIYFSYGMTKSASTYAYRLLWLALEDAGFPQPKLPADLVDPSHSVNFIGHLTPDQIDRLCDIARTRGYPLLVKTHSSPDPGMIPLLQRGEAVGCAIYRDPRDISLSMLDHGAKARRKGHWAFKEYETIDDTLPSLRGQLTCLEKWLKLPNIRPIRYQDVVFDTANVLHGMAAQLNLNLSPDAVIKKTQNRKYIQFNKGLHNRYLEQMPLDNSRAIATEFQPLLDMIYHLPTQSPALAPDAQLRQT